MSVPMTAYPFDGQSTTEQQYGSLFGVLQDDGVAAAPTSTAGSVSAGSGMQVTVQPFGAYLSGVVAELNSAGTLTIAAAGGQTRYDRIVARVDSTQNAAVLDILTGTAGSGSAPAPTQTQGGVYELPLATITVPSGLVNIAAGNIADERIFISRRVFQQTTAVRRAGSAGDFAFNHTTQQVEYRTTSGWSSILPMSEGSWAPGYGGDNGASLGVGGSTNGRSFRLGSKVNYIGRVGFGASAVFGGATLTGFNVYGNLNTDWATGSGWYDPAPGSGKVPREISLIPTGASQFAIFVVRDSGLQSINALGTPTQSDQIHFSVEGVLA